MIVQLKWLTTLASPDKCGFADGTTYELGDGQTVENLIRISGIDLDDVKIAIVNGRVVGLDAVLNDGDRIALAPAVAALKTPLSCINKAKRVNCGDW